MTWTFSAELPADRYAPKTVRRRLRQWFAQRGWPREDAEDLLLAVSEAVSNAVEHAYGPTRRGMVRVHVRRESEPSGGHRLTATITDDGTWRDPPVDNEYRRRGIPMMRAITDSLTLEPSATGTRVHMTSRRRLA